MRSRSSSKKSRRKATPTKASKPLTFLAGSDPAEQIRILSTIVNNMGDELMLTDTEGRILYVNDATIRSFGFSRKYILSKRVVDFFGARTSIKKWKEVYLARLQRARKPMSFQLKRKVKGGKNQIIDITAAYIKFKDRAYILSVARDMTRPLEIQRKLNESKELYRLLSEGAGDGIFTVDLKGRIVYANRALEEMVHVPLTESQGKLFTQYIARDSMARALQSFRRVKNGQAQVREEIEILDHKRNKIPVEINASPLYKNGRINFVHAIIRDIRGRRHLEKVIQESDKMKAIQYVVSGTAQELRYPLLGISQLSQGLLDCYQNRNFEYIGYNEFKDIFQTLNNINKQIKYCCSTIEHLISLNRKKAGLPKKSCHANHVIREVVRLHAVQFKNNNIQCRYVLDQKLPQVAIGQIELTQIMTNLLNNAEQSMPAGGICRIKTAFQKNTSKVAIIVRDEGVGISHEVLPHIFEPFFTTKQRGINKNSGLGLSIVSSLVRASQGTIRVTSSQRRGTSLTILLPRVKKSS